jgi:hypothetical protein
VQGCVEGAGNLAVPHPDVNICIRNPPGPDLVFVVFLLNMYSSTQRRSRGAWVHRCSCAANACAVSLELWASFPSPPGLWPQNLRQPCPRCMHGARAGGGQRHNSAHPHSCSTQHVNTRNGFMKLRHLRVIDELSPPTCLTLAHVQAAA